MKLNRIYNGDCVEILSSSIEAESIDCIYADPPYNLSGKKLNLSNNTTGGPFYKMNEAWDTYDRKGYEQFTASWMEAGCKTLKPNGSLYVSCTHHNLGEVLMAGKKLGLKMNNILTWYKTNAMPSITKRTFTHCTEYVCWFVKGKNWKFNYQALKIINPHRTKEGDLKQLRDFFDFIELPIVQGPERLKGCNGRALHPTQKPEKLLEIIITASTDPGDIILDPFFGTGTTGAVASRMGRNWIGIEASPDYARIASERIFGKEAEHV